MSKYLIETVSIKKYQYVIEAYSEEEAIEKGPYSRHIDEFDLGQHIFSIRPLNEYEYNKDWKEKGNENVNDDYPEDSHRDLDPIKWDDIKDSVEEKYFNYGGTNGDL